MLIEEAIHRRLTQSADLAALLPMSSVVTNQFPDENTLLPFMTLTRQGSSNVVRTTSNAVNRTSIRFQIWSESYTVGSGIMQTVTAEFDYRQWQDGPIHVIAATQSNDYSLREDDGVLQFVLDIDFDYQQDLP